MIELSPGLMGAALHLLALLKRYEIPSCAGFAASTPFLQNTKTEDVLGFAAVCGLVATHRGAVRLSDLGVRLNASDHSEAELKRILLRAYIKACRPSWASLLTKGRMESFPYFDDDVKACFFDAGLMESPPGGEVVCWWDDVSELLYGQKSGQRTRIGRRGELLTLDYERLRTGRAAQWQAIESNRLGYDVLSTVDARGAAPLLIEVKTSQTLFSSSLAYVTRHEWEVAERSPHYRFYLWSIYGGRTRLAALDAHELRPHIPRNTGKGRWETVSLNYSAFKNRFTEVAPP